MTLHAAYRWSVGISDDLRMMLGLYALPASLTHMEGNPIFKGPKWNSPIGSFPFHRAQKTREFQGLTPSHFPT